MIVVYTSPGCASCRKVKAWLNERHLPFMKLNIYSCVPKMVQMILFQNDPR